jgi:TrwC relaxase
VECDPVQGWQLRSWDGGVGVLTVAKVTQASAGEYADYLEGKARAAELGDYYLKEGERVEAPGRWAAGAEALGAHPELPVTGEQLRLLMAVRRPDTGGPLRRAGGSGEAVAALDAPLAHESAITAQLAAPSIDAQRNDIATQLALDARAIPAPTPGEPETAAATPRAAATPETATAASARDRAAPQPERDPEISPEPAADRAASQILDKRHLLAWPRTRHPDTDTPELVENQAKRHRRGWEP